MKTGRRDVKTDVVIIGTGASGFCAALTASFGGARVIILEKMAEFGGMSQFAKGMFAVESRMQKRQKIGLTVEQAFKRHMANCYWLADPRLVRTYFEKTASTIDWLEGLGVQFEPFVDSYAIDGPKVWHAAAGWAGQGLMQPLLKKIQSEKNIQMLFETEAKRLIMGKGKVAGVSSEDKEGNTIEVKAEAVIIATGGYCDNPEWMEKYCKAGHYIKPLIPSRQTGDGISMAWEVGAAAEGLGVLQAYVAVKGEVNMETQLQTVGMQPYLWVNKRGERFADESIRWNFPMATNSLAQQPEATGFCLFDENTKKYLKEQGIDYGIFYPPTTKMTEIDSELDRGLKEGKVFVGNSLKELAKKINIDFQALEATVNEYNGFCDKGHDALFAKDRKYLQVVRTPKFYAIEFCVKSLISEGGIKINYKTEVVDKENKTIPGLYAVGCCAGGLVGETYPLETTGGSLGFAVNSGRIAGENVLKYLGR
jgi:fumarate reductase flavoprotein subunit